MLLFLFLTEADICCTYAFRVFNTPTRFNRVFLCIRIGPRVEPGEFFG